MNPFPRLCAYLTVATACGGALLAAPAVSLPRSTPESQGVSSAGVLEFVEAVDKIDAMHSFMLVRHGKVVAEGWWTPYNPDSPHVLFSLSKSFTSTAVGLAVAEGKLSVDDEVLKFFPEDAPANPAANLKNMRVRDLLTMSTGHQDEPSSAPDKVSAKSFLAQPVPHKPGTHFKYNTAATFMQSAIVQKQTGLPVFDYLQPRLFAPLGIVGASWATNFQGISLGGYGLKVRTEDIAKFGQLYLQKGKWNGKQLVPEAWVETATAKQVSNGSNPKSDWDQGYGFQFWRSRNGAFRGDGAFGQYCLVLPEQDAVIAITSGVKDMQGVLNVVWDKLLPAMKPKALSADSASRKKLESKLAHLTVRRPEGAATSPMASKISGRRFVFSDNEEKLESLSLEPGSAGANLILVTRTAGKESRLALGSGDWKTGTINYATSVGAVTSPEPVAASAAWANDETLVVKLCLYESPFHLTLRLRFDGDTVTRDAEANVGFGGTKRPQLIGRKE